MRPLSVSVKVEEAKCQLESSMHANSPASHYASDIRRV